MIADSTIRFHRPTFMRPTIKAWTLNRATEPVRGIILHHAAGWYAGGPLTESASETQERHQIDQMALDHFARFDIGPAYHYSTFPSGRAYAIGKAGTHRAHTKGRAVDLRPWNRVTIGVVAMGNYNEDVPTEAMLDALREIVAEIRGWSFTANGRVPVMGHGMVPTVDAAGSPFSQATGCPGRFLLPFATELNGVAPYPTPSAALAHAASDIDDARGMLP